MTQQEATQIAERLGVDLSDPDLEVLTVTEIVDIVRQIPWTGEEPTSDDELNDLYTALVTLGIGKTNALDAWWHTGVWPKT